MSFDPSGVNKRARVADIVAIASYLWGVPVLQITGKQRHKYLCRARFACSLVAKEHGHSFPMIGRVLGRDHSTIIYGARMAELHMDRDPQYAQRINRLRELSADAKPFVADRIG